MRKFVITSAVALGLYSGLWYYQASQLQNGLQKHLDQYADNKTFGLSIAHDGISKSGFPLSINLGITNPKIRLLGEMLYPAEIAVEGSLVGSFNLLGRPDSVQLNGKTHIHLPQVDENPAVDSVMEGNFAVGFSQNNAVAGKQIYTVTVDARDVDFQFLDKDVYSDKFRQLVQIVHEQLAKQKEKTNFHFSFELELPDAETLARIKDSPFTLLTQQVPSFSFNVKDYSQTNSFGSTTSHGKITLDENAAHEVMVHISSETHLKILKAYHDAMLLAVDDVIKNPNLSGKMHEFLVQHKAEIEELVPQLHNLGTIICEKDLTVSCSKINFDTKILLPKFELLCDLYGLKIHGMGQRVGGEIAVELTIDLIKYRALIDSLISYFNQVIVLCDDTLQPISDSTKAMMLAYLQDISTSSNDTSDSIQIVFGYNEVDGPRVGKLPFELFVAKTSELVEAIQQDIGS